MMPRSIGIKWPNNKIWQHKFEHTYVHRIAKPSNKEQNKHVATFGIHEFNTYIRTLVS